MGFAQFLVVILSSIMIGYIFGALTAFTTKYSDHIHGKCLPCVLLEYYVIIYNYYELLILRTCLCLIIMCICHVPVYALMCMYIYMQYVYVYVGMYLACVCICLCIRMCVGVHVVHARHVSIMLLI